MKSCGRAKIHVLFIFKLEKKFNSISLRTEQFYRLEFWMCYTLSTLVGKLFKRTIKWESKLEQRLIRFLKEIILCCENFQAEYGCWPASTFLQYWFFCHLYQTAEWMFQGRQSIAIIIRLYVMNGSWEMCRQFINDGVHCWALWLSRTW